MNSTINTKVSEINSRIDALDTRVKTLEDSLSEIKSQISALQDEINALKDKLSNIIGRMVSISHIPTYADGMENVSYTMSGTTIVPGSFTLRFEIQPASLAEDLAANWNTALSVKAVYTKTRASAGDFAPLTIESATASDGILSFTVSADGLDATFFQGELTARARLKISDGSNNIVSEYIRLKPTKTMDSPTEDDYVDDTGLNFGPGVIIDGITWAPVNSGSTENDFYGDYYYYYGLNYYRTGTVDDSICPDGWRWPTKSELELLAANSSEFLTYKGMRGRWFSGSTPYSEGVPAIFLPASGFINKKGYSEQILVYGYYMCKKPVGNYVYVLQFGSSSANKGSIAYGDISDNSDSKRTLRCVKE